MAIESKVTGNLLQNPEQRIVKVKGEERTITEIRVFSDSYKKIATGELIQDDDKCTPVECTIWNERLGEAVMAHFRKGCRVQVEGTLHLQHYTSKESGEARTAVAVDVETVTLVPYRIEQIKFKAKAVRQEQSEGAATEGVAF